MSLHPQRVGAVRDAHAAAGALRASEVCGASGTPRAVDAAADTLAAYLTEADWRAALARIDRHPAAPVPDNRRVGRERIPRVLNCLVRLESTDGQPPAIHLVRTRNISAGGLAIVHGRAIPVGTPLVVALEAAAGQGLIQRAEVVWTRPLEPADPHRPPAPPAHEMGLKFERDIFVDQFLGH